MTTKQQNNGVIVALLPSREYTDSRPTIVDHHLTVVYLGKQSDPEITDKAVNNFWEMLGKLWEIKIRAKIAGETVFPTPQGWAHVDLIDAPFLPDFRAIAQEALDVTGLPVCRDIGFIPHITRRYIQQTDPIEMVHRETRLKFALDRVVLWRGDQRYERPLS